MIFLPTHCREVFQTLPESRRKSFKLDARDDA